MDKYIIPGLIFIIMIFGLIERKEIFTIFTDGAKEGINVMIKIFPTLIGIFLCVGMMRESGLLDFVSEKVSIITRNLNIPSEIIPLICIKPISGSATIAIATDLMRKFGTESKIGMLAAAIMSSSETTFYVIALYLSSVKIKDSRGIFISAILADLASIVVAIILIK